MQNLQNHLKIMRKYKSNPVSIKGVMVNDKKNPRTAIMIMTKRYMHLCHEYLVMTNVIVDILVTVCN